MVWFQTDNYHELAPQELRLRWDKTNLTVDESAKVRISVWGYREDTVNPKMEYIDMLAVCWFSNSKLLYNEFWKWMKFKQMCLFLKFQDGVINNGDLKIFPVADFSNRDNGANSREYTFGFIQINLTVFDPIVGMSP